MPVGWRHPVEYNPHWEFQQSTPYGRSKPASRLHGRTEQFVSLCDDYPGAVASWEQEVRDMEARTGFEWEFALHWHITGYDDCSCHPGQAGVTHPYTTYAEDGNTEIAIDLTGAGRLHELKLAEVRSQRPNPAEYMPVFDQPTEELGWCLYETVSEGTPVTPVFATAEDLIDHLATVGQDWDQVPMRRSAAEALVRSGSSIGSFLVTGGRLLSSDKDADIIASLGG